MVDFTASASPTAATSAEIAESKGPFAGYAKNREPMLRVMSMHRDAAYAIDRDNCPEELWRAAVEDWDAAYQLGQQHGYRNAQATVLAPILSFTAEEAWQHLPGEREESVHLARLDVSDWHTLEATVDESAVRNLLGLRDAVLAALEDLRQAGSIGKSEEADVVYGGETEALERDLDATGIDLRSLLIVSRCEPGEPADDAREVPEYPGLRLRTSASAAVTCSLFVLVGAVIGGAGGATPWASSAR